MIVKIVTIYNARDKSVLISRKVIGYYELVYFER
jgi:hypothetical protein